MKNYNISNLDNENEILKSLIDTLTSICPIVDDRTDILFPLLGKRVPELEIHFDFRKIDDQEFTQVSFLGGTSDYKCSVPNNMVINKLISKKVVCDFIEYLLNDHDVIRNIYKVHNSIQLPMTINLCDQNMHGIGCGDITLNFDFDRHPDNEKLFDEYLRVIITTFRNKLENTETFKREFSRYCGLVKTELINSLSLDQLKEFINLLDMQDLCSVVYSLPDDRFIELYGEYENQEKDKQLIKLPEN